MADEIQEHEKDLGQVRDSEASIMAESPSGHHFVVTVSPDREERYKIVETRVQERVQDLEEVSEQWMKYKTEEKVIVNVIEESKAMVGETKTYGVDLEAMKVDFGRINVCYFTLCHIRIEN